MTEGQAATLALYGVPGVGAKMFARLIARFGSAQAAFRASSNELMTVEKLGPKTAGNILSFDRDGWVAGQERRMERTGARMIVRGDDEYPALLDRFISAPPVLFVRGDVSALHEGAVAFVGTRQPTGYGRAMARNLASGVAAAGMCVVSGMASGIDGEAHRAAIDAGGTTAAVFGCGVDVIFPPEHRELAGDIAAHGCLVSHFPMGTPGIAGNFPARNAVIVGLARGTVVVEAPMKSGALITADLTLRAGRALFAVPGNIDSETSKGTNALLSRGAVPALSVADILRGLGEPVPDMRNNASGPGATEWTHDAGGPVKEARTAPCRPLPPGMAGQILGALREHGELHIEAICERIDAPVAMVLPELTLMEMDCLVRQKPGKMFLAV